MKALHPSDPLVEVRGIPDKSAIPSVFLNYQSTYSVSSPDPTKTLTWEFLGQLIPHPINFLTIGSSAGPHNGVTSFLNSQLTGGTHVLKRDTWLSLVERWRLAYMSVTIYQDAPALSNQGTLVAAQHVVAPQRGSLPYIFDQLGAYNGSYMFPNIYTLQASDVPTYDTLQSMPNAYFNRSQEGLYMPLKLTRTCQNWRSASDLRLFMNENVQNAESRANKIPLVAETNVWPFFGSNGAFVTCDPVTGMPTNAGGLATSDYCNDVWATFAARNLSPTTSFSFFVRAGFEVQVQPGTVLTSHQMLSPKHDREALAMYFAISREMKDGYPADYNTTGKILSTISGLAKIAAPALSLIPGVGPILGGAASGLGALTGALDTVFSRSGTNEVARLASGAQGPAPRLTSGDFGTVASQGDVQRARNRRAIQLVRPAVGAVRAAAAAQAGRKRARRRRRVRGR